MEEASASSAGQQPPALAQRLMRGAQAQLFGHVARVGIQLGTVALLAKVWGLSRYGDWLILAAVPTYLAFSDIGFFAAASNEMIMAVGREDRAEALVVFQAVSMLVAMITGVLCVVLPLLALVPLHD